MNSLKWQLSYAVGYMQLGMYADAEAELFGVDAVHRFSPEVLAVSVELYHQCKDWHKLSEAAESLIDANSANPGAWVSAAYALRRLKGIYAAKMKLLEALTLHPSEPTIQFNLGCYSAQLGEFDEAECYVRSAIGLDPAFKKIAQEDEDLEPLRATGLNFI